ncbi:MAG: glycosyltransferase [Thaumarchaeota archaeon]|nr:glycosyltransferase [Nitrososphaerota archaeon]
MTHQEYVGAKDAPRVSIILPLYNSAKELPSALSELDNQSFRNREIILVDDGSSDETWKTATTLSTGRADLFLLRTEHRGPAHARNAGWRQSRGAIVFFSESDCVYDKTYLQRAVECLDTQKEAAAVCLTGAPLITRSTLATECIDIENKVQHRLLSQGKIKPFYAWVYRREVLVKLGGFDEDLFQAEDKDLFRRLKNAKFEVAWVPGVNWRHIRDQTTLDLSRKWFGRGRTRLLYLLKHRRTLEILKTVLPLWVTVLGVVLSVWFPLLGALVLLLVAVAFLANTVRITLIAWSSVTRRRYFIGYPLFTIARNFSTAFGYSSAMITILVRKLQGKQLTWDTL